MSEPLPAGYTVADLARRYRVGCDKIRAWIKSGELAAINTGLTSLVRPRFVITPEALAEFERRRAAAQPKPTNRRAKRVLQRDFYSD